MQISTQTKSETKEGQSTVFQRQQIPRKLLETEAVEISR